MSRSTSNRAAHLELQTAHPARACAFLETMFGMRTDRIRVGDQEYLGLDLGGRIDGGVVLRHVERPLWLPYVEVDDIAGAERRARTLGASIVLPPREGPVGWRSILVAPGVGEIALWQPKR